MGDNFVFFFFFVQEEDIATPMTLINWESLKNVTNCLRVMLETARLGTLFITMFYFLRKRQALTNRSTHKILIKHLKQFLFLYPITTKK
jgi:hypothetical protein